MAEQAVGASGTFPFLRLPTELREHIYRLVVVFFPSTSFDLSFELVHTRQDPEFFRRTSRSKLSPCQTDRSISGMHLMRYQHLSVPIQPALSTVCREIRAEVLPIFYGENRIYIGLGTDGESPDLPQWKPWWLESAPFLAAAKYVRNLTIEMGVWACHRPYEYDHGTVSLSVEPRTGTLKVETEDDINPYERCCCRIQAFVAGLNARERAPTLTLKEDTSTRSRAFVRWVVETMAPALLQPYRDHEGDDCRLCGLQGCTLLALLPAGTGEVPLPCLREPYKYEHRFRSLPVASNSAIYRFKQRAMSNLAQAFYLPYGYHYDISPFEQPPFDTEVPASTRVFAIFELLEMILLYLKDSLQLFALQDVCHAFRFVIRNSKALSWWSAEAGKSHWWEKRLDCRLVKATELSWDAPGYFIRPGWIYDGPLESIGKVWMRNSPRIR
ncbi:hypothetical protein LTR56_021131 [Elasticomyces elasticus]|nr:hypothetical protein LTR56_021131 [Elasticomyces elasticus]KAK3631806.1 hypothetical protein LTR22_020874 [Elasticomyces elasticus]KAK4909662.1 hypothetical protein LTR49_021556 [Elasticomyces elasticus]KAK5749524.1 hypothetical protein LTS12_020390 [Elasticomyces elasticus]